MDDITVMMDDKNHPKHLWPTRDRIVRLPVYLMECSSLKLRLP